MTLRPRDCNPLVGTHSPSVGVPVCPPRSPRESAPGTTHSPSRVATSGPLRGIRGVAMSGAIDGPVRGASGQSGGRRVRRNGVGSLCPALGRNSMICIEWRRERRVFSLDFPGGRKPEKLRTWSWDLRPGFQVSRISPRPPVALDTPILSRPRGSGVGFGVSADNTLLPLADHLVSAHSWLFLTRHLTFFRAD